MEVILSKNDTEISEIPCCSTYKCFSTVDKELIKNERVIISAANRTRRAFLVITTSRDLHSNDAITLTDLHEKCSIPCIDSTIITTMKKCAN